MFLPKKRVIPLGRKWKAQCHQMSHLPFKLELQGGHVKGLGVFGCLLHGRQHLVLNHEF